MMRGASALGTLVLFLLILFILGVLWVASGGPGRPIARSGPFLSPPTAPGVQEESGGSFSGVGEDLSGVNSTPSRWNIADDWNTANTWSEGQTSERGSSILDYFFNFRRGGGVGEPDSPYTHEVELRKGDTGSKDPKKEYVTLRTARGLSRNLVITDWTIESTVHGIKVPLGQAAQLPLLGHTSSAVPVAIGPDSVVYIVTGRPPNGTSFRVNKCTGYFEQFQDFTPFLRTECPRPEDEALLVPHKTGGNDECIDLIERIPQCQMYTEVVHAGIVGSSCRDFIVNDLTYAGCVARHKNDSDFYKNEWRIYLHRDQELWANAHEQILLRDENGKLIALISY